MDNAQGMCDKAVDLFLKGFHCSQAILQACSPMLEGKAPSEELIAAMAPFGGGMGSSGKVCGTLSGALALIGYTMGKTRPQDRDHKDMWRLSFKLVKGFEKLTQEYGGVNCSNIARVDWKDRNSVKSFYKDPNSRRRECVKVIRGTCAILQDILSKK